MEKPKSLADFLCARLRALRKKHDLTQEAFTEIAQMNLKHYQEIEAGRKRELRLSTIERIAKAYEIEVYQLFAPSDPPSKVELSKIKPPHYKRKKPLIKPRQVVKKHSVSSF